MNSINVEDDNVGLLFEQVVGQMADQCITIGTMSKHQVVVIFEELIQMIERGTLANNLRNV